MADSRIHPCTTPPYSIQYSMSAPHRCSAVSTTLHTTAYSLVSTACICNGTGIRLNRPIVRRHVRFGQHPSCKLMRTFDGSKGARILKVHYYTIRNLCHPTAEGLTLGYFRYSCI